MNVAPRADLPPFQGGAAGFFGYDLARGLEKLPALPSSSSPDMAVGLYDQVAAFDHADNKAWLIVLASDSKTAETKHAHFLRLLTVIPKQRNLARPAPGIVRCVQDDKRYLTGFPRSLDRLTNRPSPRS